MMTIVTNYSASGGMMPDNNRMMNRGKQLWRRISRFFSRLKFSVLLPGTQSPLQSFVATFFQQFTLTQLPSLRPHDVLRIDKKKKAIKSILSVTKFRDRDTKQIVLYAPCFELTIHGESMEQAVEVLYGSLKELFEHFVSLPPEELEHELSSLGWEKNGSFHHVYYHIMAVAEGGKEQLNAAENSIEYLALTAA